MNEAGTMNGILADNKLFIRFVLLLKHAEILDLTVLHRFVRGDCNEVLRILWYRE